MATISIADNDARVQYTQAVTADVTQLTIDFPFFELDNINVIATTSAGVDTVLTRGTGTGTFAVNGTAVDDGFSGGNVTLGDNYANTFTFTVFRDIAVARTTDFPTSGPFNVSSLNTELDRITAIEQELETKISRTLGLSDSDASAALSLPNLNNRKGTVLAFNETSGLPEAGPSIGSVTTVASQSANINTLAGISSDITTVAGISSNVTTVADISGNVTTVAGNTSNINAVVADEADIGTVATNISNVNTVAGISSNVTSVAGNASNINAVAADATDIGTVSSNISNVNTVAGVSSNVTTVAGQTTNMQNITDNLSAVQNAATNAATATTKAGEAATSATASASSASSASTSATAAQTAQTAAETAETNSETAETNSASSASASASSASSASTSAGTATTQAGIATTKAGEASTSASNAASSASSASSAQTAAESARDATLAAYDNFDDRYLGTKSTAPTVDNDGDALVAGALYFDSVAGAMFVYTGSAWVAAYVSGTGFLALTGGTMTGDLNFGDNDKAIFGAGDLQIYHDASESIIEDVGTGDLKVRGSDEVKIQVRNAANTAWHNAVVAADAGAVSLYHNNSPKLATTASGINVTGSVVADGLTVDGIATAYDLKAVSNTPTVQLKSPNQSNGYQLVANVTDAVDGGISIQDVSESNAKRLNIGAGGGISFYDSTGVTMGFLWDASTQRLGLGTTTPSNLLTLDSTSDLTIRYSNGGTFKGYVGVATSAGSLMTGSTTDELVVRSTDGIAFAANNARAMTIDSSGNVGVGTNTPDSLLELYRGTTAELRISTNNAGTAQLSLNEGTSTTIEGFLKYDGASNNVVLGTSGAANALVIPRDTGNVGIGTAAPSTLLHLSSTSPLITLTDTDTGADHRINAASSAGNLAFDIDVNSETASPSAVFNIKGSEKMRIASSGNVGIGTASPNVELEISGASEMLRLQSTDTNKAWVAGYGSGTSARWLLGSNASNDSVTLQASNSTGELLFKTGGANERMRIESSGSITVKGEGSATTSVQQGLAKAWVKFTQVGTHTAADSFNLTSLTDSGVGNTTVAIANDLANANGPISVTSDNGSNFNNGAMGRMTAAGTASVRCSATTNAAGSDKAHTQVIICGDLA